MAKHMQNTRIRHDTRASVRQIADVNNKVGRLLRKFNKKSMVKMMMRFKEILKYHSMEGMGITQP
jgi:hypothetical protein